ncbi:superinfection exclusion B family protein [Neiella marina]|uniref:Superinfection exclusion B family protein n=1 Tax=Neiella holothuriorum TaxID=2870530 RepID=A0ABS7EKR0_9GAMM|nr:super-infection exclusion protein B [Neiella holothuriorum]MBW8192916.1 superinfection exclusion B family protein [Neiella holothuriorum]
MKAMIYDSPFNRSSFNRALLVAFVISGLLLFIPDPMLAKLNLAGVMAHYGAAVSLIYLGILSYFAVQALSMIWQAMSERWRWNRNQDLARNKALSFDHEERALLREFFLQRRSSLILPIHQEAVQRLTQTCVLQEIESNEPLQEGQARFVIAASARPFMTSNNLRLPVSELTDDDIRYFKAARPEYIKAQLKQQWREQLKAQRRQAA